MINKKCRWLNRAHVHEGAIMNILLRPLACIIWNEFILDPDPMATILFGLLCSSFFKEQEDALNCNFQVMKKSF